MRRALDVSIESRQRRSTSISQAWYTSSSQFFSNEKNVHWSSLELGAAYAGIGIMTATAREISEGFDCLSIGQRVRNFKLA